MKKIMYFLSFKTKSFFVRFYFFLMALFKKRIIIMAGTGIGDGCLSMAYIHEFLKKDSNYTLYWPKNIKWLLDEYSPLPCRIKYISKKKYSSYRFGYQNLSEYSITYKLLKLKHFIFMDTHILYKNDLDFMPGLYLLDILKYCILKLDSQTKIVVHQPKKTYIDNSIKQNSVLINTNSNSSWIKSSSEWQELINKLNDSGYYVYVNAVSENDYKYDNAMNLVLKMDEMFSIIDKFEMVISIRSGFLDYMVPKIKKLICLNDSIHFLNIWSLKQWKEINPQIKITEKVYDRSCRLIELIGEDI